MNIRATVWFLLFALATQPCTAAGNFEFVLEAPRGLVVQFAGYDQQDGRLFIDTTRETETRNGAPVYVVRADEEVVKGRLARWCIKVLAGDWTEIPKGQQACDTQLREERGSFLFSMENVSPEPEFAVSGALECVFNRLRDGGYVDVRSKVSPQEVVRRAGMRYAALHEGAFPLLDEGSANDWCRQFDNATSSPVAAPPPFLGRLNLGPDLTVKEAREIASALIRADDFMSEKMGYRLQTPPAMYLSADPEWLAESYAEKQGASSSERAQNERRFAECNGGEANFDVLFMCTKSKVYTEDWYGMGGDEQRAYSLVHELVHVMQNELVGPVPAGCCDEQQALRRLGPTWLVEGGAEYAAYHYLLAHGWKKYASEMQYQRSQADKYGVAAENIELRGAYYGGGPGGNYRGVSATEHLAAAMGPQTLPRFWQGIGSGLPWADAFIAAFGITPSDFYSRGDRRVTSEVTEKEMVQCLQASLNTMGFKAGPPDGVLGKGTRAAFEAYKAVGSGPFNKMALDKPFQAGGLCLYLTRKGKLGMLEEEIAARLAQQATFSSLLGGNPEAIETVQLRDREGNDLVKTSVLSLTTRRDTGETVKELRAPYSLAGNASQLCLTAADGWASKGADSRLYKTVCNAITPEYGVIGFGLSFDLVKLVSQ